MASDSGFSIYFKFNRIRFRNTLMSELGNPEYIHLFIDSKSRFMFIQGCERDRDAFKVYYREDGTDMGFYIRTKLLVRYIASLIGADETSTYRFSTVSIDSNTMMTALDEYEDITKGEE